MKTERKGKWQKRKNKVTDLSTNISVITLNANVLNTSIKDRDWWNRLKKKYDNHIVPVKNSLQIQQYRWVECKRMEKVTLCKYQSKECSSGFISIR